MVGARRDEASGSNTSTAMRTPSRIVRYALRGSRARASGRRGSLIQWESLSIGSVPQAILDAVTAAARRRATYADVLAAPPDLVAEVVLGVLYTHPRPAAPHTRAASRLGMTLGGPFDLGNGGPGGWIILDEPELHLGKPPEDDILVPDLAAWRRERMPEVGDRAFFTLAPDWICEVLSPSTSALDRSEKMHVYAREGVRHAWLLDPIARTLEVYRRATPTKKRRASRKAAWVLVDVWHDDSKVRAEPFDVFTLALAGLWS